MRTQTLESLNQFDSKDKRKKLFIGKQTRQRRDAQISCVCVCVCVCSVCVCVHESIETRITVTLSAQPRLTASLASCWQAASNLSSWSDRPGFSSTLPWGGRRGRQGEERQGRDREERRGRQGGETGRDREERRGGTVRQSERQMQLKLKVQHLCESEP